MKQLEKTIEECVSKFEHLKVNLTRDETSTNGEGCWAVPCTQEDKDIYGDESKSGQKFNVYLCNQPFSWHGKNWGDKIVAVTGGASRPYARLSDNPEAKKVYSHAKFTKFWIKSNILWGESYVVTTNEDKTKTFCKTTIRVGIRKGGY